MHVSNKRESENGLSSSEKANSAIPLAPGVGLTSISNQSISCFPRSTMCCKAFKEIKAITKAFIIKYRLIQANTVAPKVFNQKTSSFFFIIEAVTMISLEKVSAEFFHLLNHLSLVIAKSVFPISLG